MGFAPADKPKVIAMAIIDEPKGDILWWAGCCSGNK